MHRLWPIGLIFSLLATLPGCALLSNKFAHRAKQLVHGQAQCAESKLEGCPVQSHPETNDFIDSPALKMPAELAFRIDQRVLDTSSQRFVFHSGSGKYESYIAQNIPFKPVEDLRKNIELRYGLSLKHRGEAHITVVTPPEFERLSSHLTIRTINEMVFESIQRMPYEIVCLGVGKVAVTDRTMHTFFIVVKSHKLTALRDQIAEAYIQAGGPEPAFKSEFWPHITIGFTDRDLHDSDGIHKNVNSCVYEIATSPDQLPTPIQ